MVLPLPVSVQFSPLAIPIPTESWHIRLYFRSTQLLSTMPRPQEVSMTKILRDLRISEEDEEALDEEWEGPTLVTKYLCGFGSIMKSRQFQEWLHSSVSGVCYVDSKVTENDLTKSIFTVLKEEVSEAAQQQQPPCITVCSFSCSAHAKDGDSLGGPFGLWKAIIRALLKSETLMKSRNVTFTLRERQQPSVADLLSGIDTGFEAFAKYRRRTEAIFIVIEGSFIGDETFKKIVSTLETATKKSKEGVKVLVDISSDKPEDKVGKGSLKLFWDKKNSKWVLRGFH